jgi:uncharacterized protein
VAETSVASPRPKSRFRKVAIWLFAVLLVVYVAASLLFYFQQDALVFPAPTNYPKATPLDAGIPFEDLHIPVNGSEQLHAWWIPAASPSDKVLLLFHGNGIVMEMGITGEHAPDNEFIRLHRLGVNLLLIDYRGYGSSSPGRTTEKRVFEDARAAFDYLTTQRKIPSRNIIFVGRSVGTGPATEIAKEQADAGGLILISPFTSTTDILKTIPVFRPFPLALLLHNQLDNLSRIDAVHIPLFIAVGTADTLTPPAMAQALFQKANAPKQLVVVPGAEHNGIMAVGGQRLEDQIGAFIQTIH